MTNFPSSLHTRLGEPRSKAPPLISSRERSARRSPRIRKRDLIFIFRNVAILVENGVALPRALETLFLEKGLRRYGPMLQDIQHRVDSGETFSDALAKYPHTFDELLVNQIRVGERSGTMPAAINRLVSQLEHADNLRASILKRLAYPALLVTAGTASVTFMLLYVVPTFQSVYEESHAKLPALTQFLINVSNFGVSYGWLIAFILGGLVAGLVTLRRNPAGRLWFDSWLLRAPLIGRWFQNLAVLQFMEVLGNLMDAGFTVVEAIKASAPSVGNRAIRQSIELMHEAVTRGERFSDELGRRPDLFPPVVNQLVMVGEKTGTLSKTTVHIRAHLRREVETYTNIMIATIEPAATATLAAVIGCILLAIYLPMFDMINAMNGGAGG